MRSITLALLIAAAPLSAGAAELRNPGFERLEKWKVFERVALAPTDAKLPKKVTRKTSQRVRLYAAFGWPIRVRGKLIRETRDEYHILMADDMPAALKKSEARVVGDMEFPTDWRFHDVVHPATIEVSRAEPRSGQVAVVLSAKGTGRAFLHAKPFDVTPGQKYAASVWAKGTGRLGLQLLWWSRYDRIAIERATPHCTPAPLKGGRGLIKEMPNVSKEWQRISGRAFVAPADATKCYLRIMVVKGAIALDDVQVQQVSDK